MFPSIRPLFHRSPLFPASSSAEDATRISHAVCAAPRRADSICQESRGLADSMFSGATRYSQRSAVKVTGAAGDCAAPQSGGTIRPAARKKIAIIACPETEKVNSTKLRGRLFQDLGSMTVNGRGSNRITVPIRRGFRLRDHFKIVRAERRHRQPLVGVEIAHRVAAPPLAHPPRSPAVPPPASPLLLPPPPP